MGRFINFNILNPMNVIAIGAIIFFWGSLAYFARDQFTGDTIDATANAE